MKRMLLFLLVFVAVIGCSKEEKPDTPTNKARLMTFHLANSDYGEFQDLFVKDLTPTQDTFTSLSKLMTSGQEYRTYELVVLENEEMLLVRLTPNPSESNGEYKIQDVKVVPIEYRAVFEELRLNK